jgi:hypothetical protein
MAPKKAPAKTPKEKATVLVAVSNGKKVYITPTQASNMAKANRNRTDAQGRSGFGATREQVAARNSTIPSGTINWDRSAPSVAPTAAFTRPGQKATGLAKSKVQDRFSSPAKTKLSTGIFAGSGTPLGTGKMFNVTKGNVTNAALTIVASPASVGRGAIGPVTSAVSKQVSKYVGGKSLSVLSQGLNKSGAGGRLYGALTPEGVALASTRIGTPSQQSARMGNLMQGAINNSRQISGSISDDAIRGMNFLGKLIKVGAVGGIVAPKVVPKNKKKK